MSAAPETEAPAAQPPATRSRRPLVAGVAALVVVVVVALVLALSGGDGPAAPTDPAAGSSAGTSAGSSEDGGSPSPDAGTGTPAPATEEPATATADADEAPPALPAAALDQPVAVQDLTASLVSVEAVDALGEGRGSISGPALLVTVRLVNGTAEALSLDGVAVNLAHGADRTPGSPVADTRQQPFTGSLAAGASAEARYVFSVPQDARDAVTVEVSPVPGAPVAVFSGPVG